MNLVAKFLPYAEIIISVILIISILLQETSANAGGAFGGSESQTFHHTRRGFEKFLFYLSIICAILFALLAFLSIIIK